MSEGEYPKIVAQYFGALKQSATLRCDVNRAEADVRRSGKNMRLVKEAGGKV